MSKFTPGPWDIEMGRALIGGHPHTCWVIGTAETFPGEGVGVAVVILPDGDDSPEARVEREATAKFICAAPEMYDYILARAVCGDTSAQAIIAKAEGREG